MGNYTISVTLVTGRSNRPSLGVTQPEPPGKWVVLPVHIGENLGLTFRKVDVSP
jgi:hypothetical protein